MLVVQIEGDDKYEGEVRGEAKYQAALENIVGGRKDESAVFECSARLVREPTNPHDHNAVRVEIDGQLVGYIAHYLAFELGRFLREQGGARAVGQCDAMIVGGWDRTGDVGSFGVRLDIARPLRVERPTVRTQRVSRVQPPQPSAITKRFRPSVSRWILAVVVAVGSVGAALTWSWGRRDQQLQALVAQSAPAPAPTPVPPLAIPAQPAAVTLPPVPSVPPPPIIKVDEPQEPPPRPANVPQPPRRPANLR